MLAVAPNIKCVSCPQKKDDGFFANLTGGAGGGDAGFSLFGGGGEVSATEAKAKDDALFGGGADDGDDLFNQPARKRTTSDHIKAKQDAIDIDPSALAPKSTSKKKKAAAEPAAEPAAGL